MGTYDWKIIKAMNFELEERKVNVKIDQEGINYCLSVLRSAFNGFNLFVDDFNAAHEGMPIEFTKSYTEAFFRSNLHQIASTDFRAYLDKSPLFLRAQIQSAYKFHISLLYDKIDHLFNSINSTLYNVSERIKNYELHNLIEIADNGKISIGDALKTTITNFYTISDNDLDLEIQNKLKLYVELENELKDTLGPYNFNGIIHSFFPENKMYPGVEDKRIFNIWKTIGILKKSGFLK